MDSVSLSEISKVAGQANHSAAHYHFGDKRTLINAIFARHSTPIQDGWLEKLETLPAEGPRGLSLRILTEIMVTPLVAKLDDEDGGRAYIAIAAQLCGSSTHPLLDLPVAQTIVTRRFAEAIAAHVDVPPMLKVLRMQRLASTMYHAIAEHAKTELVSRELFTADLVDCLVALLSAQSR